MPLVPWARSYFRPESAKRWNKLFKDYEGGIIDETEFMEKLSKVAELAIGDACTGSNPRQPSQEDMEKLLKACYYGEDVNF